MKTFPKFRNGQTPRTAGVKLAKQTHKRNMNKKQIEKEQKATAELAKILG